VEIVIFFNGSLRHTYVLPLGGSSITSDIAIGLKLPQSDAEILKVSSGCAMIQKVRRTNWWNCREWRRLPRPIRRQYLSEIIEPRAEEIFTLLRKEILRSGYEENLGAGVFSPGRSKLEGLTDLGERVFKLPFRRGTDRDRRFGRSRERPAFATSVGLVQYGAAASERVYLSAEARQAAGDRPVQEIPVGIFLIRNPGKKRNDGQIGAGGKGKRMFTIVEENRCHASSRCSAWRRRRQRINTMIEEGLQGVEFIAANTDAQALSRSLAPLKLQLGARLTKGLGAGANPISPPGGPRGPRPDRESLTGADMVFITAGWGGTGTGAGRWSRSGQEIGRSRWRS